MHGPPDNRPDPGPGLHDPALFVEALDELLRDGHVEEYDNNGTTMLRITDSGRDYLKSLLETGEG